MFRRERTGRGAVVDHALYLMGTYIMSQGLISASLGPAPQPARTTRDSAPDPLNNVYRTADGRWLILCQLYDEWWPDLARTLGREDWLADPQFARVEDRLGNHLALIEELDGCSAATPSPSGRSGWPPWRGCGRR